MVLSLSSMDVADLPALLRTLSTGSCGSSWPMISAHKIWIRVRDKDLVSFLYICSSASFWYNHHHQVMCLLYVWSRLFHALLSRGQIFCDSFNAPPYVSTHTIQNCWQDVAWIVSWSTTPLSRSILGRCRSSKSCCERPKSIKGLRYANFLNGWMETWWLGQNVASEINVHSVIHLWYDLDICKEWCDYILKWCWWFKVPVETFYYGLGSSKTR